MKRVECEFESEVLAALMQSRWPERAGTGLRAHVEQCEICASVATVAAALDEAHGAELACAAVPDAGRVWRMAQMRARREAVKAAGRPITAAQVIAFAIAMGLMGACFGATSAWFQASLGRVTAELAGADWTGWLAAANQLLTGHGAFVAGLAAAVVAVPAAVYLAIGRE